MKGLYDSLADKTDAPSLAMRARLGAAIAQSELDRAVLDTDKSNGDKLRKAGKQLAIEVAAIAQKALKAKSDDPYANLAMADVMRLQGKSAHDVDRYLQAAKSKAGDDKDLAKAIALAAAQTDVRDSFYDDALKDLGSYTTADDPHVRTVLALIAFDQGKPADARPFVDQVLAASPDHDVAHALAKRLETVVAKTDPMPVEDHGSHTNPPPTTNNTNTTNVSNGGDGGDYDALVAKAGKTAETNCPRAIELYSKALEQKPTGVEALTGIGYCYLDAKQFSSAFSKFHTALAVSQHYEPALAGVAETYQQQGNKDQAIASWRAYLDAFPGAAKAKKQLEILGADEQPANGGGGGSAQSAQPTPPAPTPAPAPAPAPAAGDGSASG
jgi:Tetratricopeptide repeat